MEREIETDRQRDRGRDREFFLNFFDQTFQINVRTYENIRKIPSW